ncbi:MAG: hypothetical protein LBU17_10075 [Treponema sp.]|nr:hypothetical protein [Treponema sp.]
MLGCGRGIMNFDFLGLDAKYEPIIMAWYAKTLLLNISKIYPLDENISICFFGDTITVYYKIDEHTNKIVKFINNTLKETIVSKHGYELERWDAQGTVIEHTYFFKKQHR